MIQVIFIRHGMVPSNAEKRYVGRTDESLSGTGRKQILSLRNSGVLPHEDIIFVSPMRRCRETADILYPDREQIVIPDFREIDFGDYEGKNAEELLADPASGYQAWIDSGGMLPFPNGEARKDFIERSRRGFGKMMEKCRKAAGVRNGSVQGDSRAEEHAGSAGVPFRAAAVVHGGTVMSILSGLCGGDYYDYMCRNGEGYQVDITGPWIGTGLKKVPEDLPAAEEPE